MSLFFTSDAHKARFLSAMQEIGKIYEGKLDQEYGAALYILTSSGSTWEKAQGYVSRRGIDIEDLLKEVDWSGGYSVLIKLAGNLFNANEHIDPVEFMRLDDRNFLVALTALQVRRRSLPVDDLK